jgi:energy-converting hydrogenase Eha subunit A
MSENIKNKIIKIFSLFGIVGTIFYFMHILFGRIFYEGYNPFAQAISDLTATSSPARNIALIFSFLYGFFTVLFSFSFFVYFKGKINKIVTFGSFFFCAMTVISFLGYTFFPLSEAGYAGTFQDIMHVIVTIFVVVFTSISILFFGIGYMKTKKYKYFGIISLCTFVLLMVGAMLINILSENYFGIAQRINAYSVVIYIGLLSLWMNKYINKYYERTNGT